MPLLQRLPRGLTSLYFVLPASIIFVSASAIYLNNSILSSLRTQQIKIYPSISPSTRSSQSLKVVNPRGHAIFEDSRSITFSKRDVRGLSDEEILTRFVKGFFGGWVFVPERGIIGVFRMMGRPMVPMSFSAIPPSSPSEIPTPTHLTPTSLSKKHTKLFNSNFIILDSHLASTSPSPLPSSSSLSPTNPKSSYIDIGFGSDKKQFSGFHRFEVLRSLSSVNKIKEKEEEGEEEIEEITIWYSSLSCNPTVNKPPFPGWVAGFHEWYAQMLFRDGVREVFGS